ncbi:SIR2 family protein [Chromobacterium subtsugae]|uniref:SIR2 family protein n=1 Tax=Chromobacterium subtsugae TaxID=251747 RepID=UPI0009B99A47|nr:SIR2 family protein [Chromobacterium subtsugae]
MSIEDELNTMFAERTSGPFLFLGSGFSRRYIGLEDWEGLLERFCLSGKPYAFYRSSSNKNIPLAAKLLANDFHDTWWAAHKFEESRKKYSDKIQSKSSPLKYEISEYLLEKTKNPDLTEDLKREIHALKECDVDGIITTNWDLLIEKIFPEYKVFSSQKELLFSNTSNIGEIYKIHGCCKKPDSLVLTEDDYKDFNERNAYLASKLITIFVEHPVIFIGYSITDENIRSLLKSISLCIGSENIEKLRDNLIFIDRNEPAQGPSIETSYLQFDSSQIPIKIIKTKDFTPIYNALSQFERKLPARVLRFCKERLYEIVKDNNPDKKIAVIDYEKIDNIEDVEIVFGIGVISQLGAIGYKAITVNDLFEDLIVKNKGYNAKNILETTIPELNTGTKFAPVFKYLNEMGINNIDEYQKSGLKIDRFIERKNEDFVTGSAAPFAKYRDYSFEAFLGAASEAEILCLTPLFTEIDNDVLFQYIHKNYLRLISGKYKYHFRRLIAFYDWKKYGF